MVKKIVHIEGHSNIGLDGGSLRESFSYLLKGNNYNIPLEIRMGKSNEDTIKRYKNHQYQHKYLFIDLETEEKNKSEVLKSKKIDNDISIFFMIQQCEAYFLSQPEILDNYFGVDFSTEYKNLDAKEIANPQGKIKSKVSKDSNNSKKYKKIEDCSILLKKLNITKLKSDFSDVHNLINALSN